MSSSAGEEERVAGVQGLDELLCTRLGNKEKGFYFLVGCLEVKTTAVCVPQVQTAHENTLGQERSFSRSVQKGGG